MRKQAIRTAIGAAIMAISLAVYADPTITVSDGTTTATATISPATGAGFYSVPSFGTDWGALIISVQTKPSLGDVSNPNMELDITASSIGTKPLTVTFSDNNFGPTSGAFTAMLNGHFLSGSGTVSYNTYFNPGNTLGAQTTLLTALGALASPFSSSVT